MKWLIVALFLAACSQGEEPIERVPTVGPWGYYKQLSDPECSSDPSCVCGLPEDQRPEYLTDPFTGERTYDYCS